MYISNQVVNFYYFCFEREKYTGKAVLLNFSIGRNTRQSEVKIFRFLCSLLEDFFLPFLVLLHILCIHKLKGNYEDWIEVENNDAKNGWKVCIFYTT